jgi:hypothetical protein
LNETVVASVEDIEFIVDWKSTTPEHATAIKAFWLRESALDAGEKAQQRLPQVVLHAQDRSGAIVGVCTAIRSVLPHIGQPMYYYRSFVAAPWRKHGVAISMLLRAEQCLGDFARSHGFPCIGILIEVQSVELRTLGSQPIWPRTRFTYAGPNPAGRRLFVHYFEGATLKD